MARIEAPTTGIIDIVLSERNLLTLLSKLYTPGSKCEIHNNDVPDGLAIARIKAERDDVHYANPSRKGTREGEMHPVTEKILDAIREVIEKESLAV